MIDILVELLKTLDSEVKRQGSYTSTSEYPDHFFTFWNDDTPSKNFYDNKERTIEWDFTIYYYALDPEQALDMIKKAKKLLKENGWIISGNGKDIFSDSKDHSGRMIKAYYLEKQED